MTHDIGTIHCLLFEKKNNNNENSESNPWPCFTNSALNRSYFISIVNFNWVGFLCLVYQFVCASFTCMSKLMSSTAMLISSRKEKGHQATRHTETIKSNHQTYNKPFCCRCRCCCNFLCSLPCTIIHLIIIGNWFHFDGVVGNVAGCYKRYRMSNFNSSNKNVTFSTLCLLSFRVKHKHKYISTQTKILFV